MKVYVILEGQYSSRYIVGIASSRERADEIVAHWGGADDYERLEIEEFELDRISRECIIFITSAYLDTGELRRARPEPEWVDDESSYLTQEVKLEYGTGREFVLGWGSTPEAAEKSARDHRALVLAQRAHVS